MLIKGTVARIFAEKESGFKVLSMAVEDVKKIPVKQRNPDFPGRVTVVGVMKGIEPEFVIETEGEWESRPNGSYWPWQFKVSEYTVCELETPQLLLRFLTLLPGMNESTAKRIILYFDKPQDIIENHYQRLTELHGITEEQAKQMHDEFILLRERQSLKAYLTRFGIGESDIRKILSVYHEKALEQIKSNPYELCESRLLSFKAADKIGAELLFAFDDKRRLRAVFNYVLHVKAGAKGHTYLTEKMLLEETNMFLGENGAIKGTFTVQALNEKLSSLIAERQIIVENGRYYSPARYCNEKDAATVLLRRQAVCSPYADIDECDLEAAINKAQEKNGIILDGIQRDAVKMAVRHMTGILTGGPGTGKTTILQTLIRTIELLSNNGVAPPVVFALAAPTGMAAKRMSLSTGLEAKTIHKLLEYNFEGSMQQRCAFNPIEADYIILDEASMVDIDMTANLLRAVRDDTQLLFVGDKDQLPSIGPGNVLCDIIDSGMLPVTKLSQSYRHGSRKTILANANKINAGDTELVMNRSDFVFYEIPDNARDRECGKLREMVERVYYEELSASGGNPLNIQVLSPLRSRTLVSADRLNPVLQRIANPKVSDGEELLYGQVIFRKGDKVMQISNNYDKGVFNGDGGTVTLVSLLKKKMLVSFDGIPVEYDETEFDQLRHSFAITVHKSQGSEYPVVIMVMTNFHSMMLVRNLFYTGETRAKQRMIIIGDRDAIRYAIRNTRGTERLSWLSERLKNSESIAA